MNTLSMFNNFLFYRSYFFHSFQQDAINEINFKKFPIKIIKVEIFSKFFKLIFEANSHNNNNWLPQLTTECLCCEVATTTKTPMTTAKSRKLALPFAHTYIFVCMYLWIKVCNANNKPLKCVNAACKMQKCNNNNKYAITTN